MDILLLVIIITIHEIKPAVDEKEIAPAEKAI